MARESNIAVYLTIIGGYDKSNSSESTH
jgi:hypothetical protein